MRTFKGYSRYRVSHLGGVYDTALGRYLAQYPNEDGYLKVTLCSDAGHRKGFSVARLVAMCYIPNHLDKPETNHKDGIKFNNAFHNLEWVTHAENIQHAWDTGLLKNTPARARKLAAQPKKMGKDNNNASAVMCATTGEVFDTIKDAVSKYGASQAQISKCCIGSFGVKSAGKHPVTGEKLIWAYHVKENINE